MYVYEIISWNTYEFVERILVALCRLLYPENDLFGH